MAISLPSKHRNFLRYWLPIIVYCLFIFIQSSYPSPDQLPRVTHLDKLLHVIAYACLGALLLRAFNTIRIQNNLKLIIALSIILSSLYGISDEIHQHFVPYRNADVVDAFMDAIGSVVGVYAYQFFVARHTEASK
ncbi:MAG: VanZ family protein [Deltaproteobacteria bacterium]|nr:VanZ family protein [Deltaproteobacteria bacterium]